MISPHAGELAALITAGLWTVAAISFEQASRKIGSLSVNLLRLALALVFLSFYSWMIRGHILPTDASTQAWFWLFISGLVGIWAGDLCLFKAFVLIGARKSMLVYSLAPPLAALIGGVVLGERLSLKDWTGMALTIGGVSWVILERSPQGGNRTSETKTSGIVLAFLAALGQAGGLVISKFGMGDYDPFASTQIRIIAGLMGFVLLMTLLRRWSELSGVLKNRSALAWTGAGAFFGTFLGISLAMSAIQLTKTGIAATIMATVPILIIPPAWFFFKERINSRAVLGATLAVGGIALLFL
ncbi:MAG: DMT family transporter [Pseudomonadota bacterium]